MLPSFLQPFEADLKKYERPAIRINAVPLEGKLLEDGLAITDSKFLGMPFFPIEQSYPKDKQGQPMIMVAQLNFEQIPPLELFPTAGILQLFLSPTHWYDGDEQAQIIYHPKATLDKTAISDFSFLSEADYEEMPIDCLHQLSFEPYIDKGGIEDVQFNYQFGGLDYYDFAQQLSPEEEQQFDTYFDATGHKIGGYADFTQTDPRTYNEARKNDIQLLQIDVSEHIMFGDMGLAHIFIHPQSLEKRDFSKAYFYWDCC